MLLFLVLIIIYKLSRVPVPAWSKVLELVADISIKDVGCIKLPMNQKLFVVDIFLVCFYQLVTF